jgi:hypothetical protein
MRAQKNRCWKYYQPNKKDIKDRVGDCSIRAFTKALGWEWLQVFDALIPYAREAQCLLNQKPCYEKFLAEQGWGYVSQGKSKCTVQEFTKKNSEGTYILYIRVGYGTHLVTVQDGYFYDTWDCGEQYIFGYYVKED